MSEILPIKDDYILDFLGLSAPPTVKLFGLAFTFSTLALATMLLTINFGVNILKAMAANAIGIYVGSGVLVFCHMLNWIPKANVIQKMHCAFRYGLHAVPLVVFGGVLIPASRHAV